MTTTIDDLDRDELLHLVRRLGLLWRPADLLSAQWEAAGDRWQAAWAEYMRLSDVAGEAVAASIAATNAFVAAARDPACTIKTVTRLNRAASAASTVAHQARDREALWAAYQEVSR